MRVDVVWLTAALLYFPLLTQCLTPLNVMVAPNLLRVGTWEKVFLEIQDHTVGNVKVNVRVMNYPRKTSELTSTEVTLTAENKYQALAQIKIEDIEKYFTDSAIEKQYVYLQAQFPTGLLEKVIMVSFQAGFIFIQTDKSIYTPGTAVQYRLFSMSPDLHPVDQSSIMVEVINNQKFSMFSEPQNTKKGVITGRFVIPEVSSPGMWTVAAYYKSTPQKNFTAEFEVKEYVLPSFEVTLIPSKAFFYVDDQEFHVDITAKYLFGKKVDGVAFVSFGVVKGDVKTELPAALSRVTIVDGEGRVTLKRSMIEATIKNVNELNEGSLYIAARVLTNTASEIVEAYRRNIPIVQSPYTIHFKRTSQYFKPAMSFDVTVYVTNPDESPAENVDLIVTAGSGEPVKGRTKSNGMAKIILNTQTGISSLPIIVKTADPAIKIAERQATSRMNAIAYKTKDSNNYLHISVDTAELKLNDHMHVTLHFGQSKITHQDITYMFLSKGQIVEVKRYSGKGQALISLSHQITKDLLPSFRMVAYYHVGTSEVVSDSIWVDVKDRCMGSLKLSVKDNPNTYEPGEPFELIVTGDPSAKVGLVAVDKGVFVLNKNRLTQTKVWDVIEKHDTGCTAGGGKDSMGVFYDAGLVFESDKAGGTSARTDRDCPTPPKRKRRAESLLQITQGLTGKFEGELKKCCTDGLRKNNMGYSCEIRAKHITDGKECADAFLYCCNEILKHKQAEREVLTLSRTNEDDEDFIGSDEIVTRTEFPESWLWIDIDLPACPGNGPCETTSLKMKENYLQDSITTWQVLAISLSETQGICVADPFEMIVVKDFFVDLKLPYSVVRNEQVEIRAVIHNYSKKDQKVRVDFLETDSICSAASKKKKYRVITTVKSSSTKAVPFVIIPMGAPKKYPIEVQVSTSSNSDAMKSDLNVVSEGVLTEKWELNESLKPSTKANGVEVLQVRSEIPEGQVPGTSASTHITVAGEELSQTIEQAISGDFMGRLIVQPHGCGEQTMIFMTLPLIATHYLDSTNQWETIGMQRRDEAVQHIKTGYERELTFRKADGSYGAWVHHPSSTWLTAYVTKVFAMANDIIAIREDMLCSSVKWLILNAQMPDGTFIDPAPVIHGEMVGDVRGKDADASLTAFVLIAMQEASELCSASVGSLSNSIKKAADYLKLRLPSLKNPYAVAMSSYALANAGKADKQILMSHSSGDGTYWQVPGQTHFSLEATAYALLALVKMGDITAAGKLVNWLNRQSSPYGSHGSTQATIMVFQAVAEYYKQARKDDSRELNVELSVSGRNDRINWKFAKSNFPVSRSDKVKLMQNFNVTATGTGSGTIRVVTLYYAKPAENQGECNTFHLAVDLQREVTNNNDEVYMLNIEYFYKNQERDATMSILDIGMLTGFKVDDGDLRELSTGKERYFEKFEQNNVLTERGSLIIYLDKVPRKLEKLSFRVQKVTPAAMLQPASVTIYEYYNPKERCVKYYHPVKQDGALNRLCSSQDGLCECAEENCSIQKKQKVEEADRDNKACEPGMDYVYKVKVMSIVYQGYSDFYTMQVEEVLKEGSDLGVEGQERSFMGHSNCREYFGFEQGKSYLVMGRSTDLPRPNGRTQYVLGEQTWIEYWPTSEEGQTDEFSERYVGIRALVQSLRDFGCDT